MVQRNRPGEFWSVSWVWTWPDTSRPGLGAWIAGLLAWSASLSWLVSFCLVAAYGMMCFRETTAAYLASELVLITGCTVYATVYLVRLWTGHRRPRTTGRGSFSRPVGTA